jgi:hypothetical protein
VQTTDTIADISSDGVCAAPALPGAGCLDVRPAGISAGGGERMCFVVLNELPEREDTLLLRLQGRGAGLPRALVELDALPATHVLRTRVWPVSCRAAGPRVRARHCRMPSWSSKNAYSVAVSRRWS